MILKDFRQKATVVGAEIKEKAEQFGKEMRDHSGGIRKEISSINGPRQGIGHAIGVLFKAFFLFISVIVTFALVMALIGLIFTGPCGASSERLFNTGILAEYYGLVRTAVFHHFTRSRLTDLADPPNHWSEKRQ